MAEPKIDSPKPRRKGPPCDHATLLKLLHYDPDTGVVTWRTRPGDLKWSSRYAGKPAGSRARRATGFYRETSIFDVNYLMHRIVWFYMTGEWPDHEIDHRD